MIFIFFSVVVRLQNMPLSLFTQLTQLRVGSTSFQRDIRKLRVPSYNNLPYQGRDRADNYSKAKIPKEGEWNDVYNDPVKPRRNGWQRPLDPLHVGSWSVILVLFILYYTIQLPFVEGSVLIVSVVLATIMAILIIGTKIFLEHYPQHDPRVFDTTLPRLSKAELKTEPSPAGLQPCFFCRRFVEVGCKHCCMCDKCVPGFDHHCRWLNSCVGTKNYRPFFCFMVFAFVGMCFEAAMSAYIVISALMDKDKFRDRIQDHAYHSPSSAFWVIVAFNIFSGLLALAGTCAVGKLIVFHIWLKIINKSTYDIIQEKRKRRRERGQKRAQETECCSPERRDFKKHGSPPEPVTEPIAESAEPSEKKCSRLIYSEFIFFLFSSCWGFSPTCTVVGAVPRWEAFTLGDGYLAALSLIFLKGKPHLQGAVEQHNVDTLNNLNNSFGMTVEQRQMNDYEGFVSFEQQGSSAMKINILEHCSRCLLRRNRSIGSTYCLGSLITPVTIAQRRGTAGTSQVGLGSHDTGVNDETEVILSNGASTDVLPLPIQKQPENIEHDAGLPHLVTSTRDILEEGSILQVVAQLEEQRLARQKNLFEEMIVFEGGATSDHDSLGKEMIMRDFVHFALYHHKWGYYPKLYAKYRQLMTTGYFDPIPFNALRSQYDFERYAGKLHETTPGFVSPTQLFYPYYGWALAEYLVTTHRAKFDPREPLIVYDIGSGTGALAASVLDYLSEHFPALYEKCEYHVMEMNPYLIPVLRNRLVHHYHHVHVHQISALNWRNLEPRRCIILAIELFSGLPHDCIVWDNKGICSEQWFSFTQHDNLATAEERYFSARDPVILRYLRYLNWLQEESFHSLKVLCVTGGRETIDPPPFGSLEINGKDNLLTMVSKILWIHSPWRTAWLPTTQMMLLEVLAQYFPRHHLFAVDWKQVRQALPGVNGPVLQVKVRVAKDLYLRKPIDALHTNAGMVDICFPTDFDHFGYIYRRICGPEKEISCMTHPEFWKTFGGEKTALFSSKSGFNPLLEDFGQLSVFTAHHSPEHYKAILISFGASVLRRSGMQGGILGNGVRLSQYAQNATDMIGGEHRDASKQMGHPPSSWAPLHDYTSVPLFTDEGDSQDDILQLLDLARKKISSQKQEIEEYKAKSNDLQLQLEALAEERDDLLEQLESFATVPESNSYKPQQQPSSFQGRDSAIEAIHVSEKPKPSSESSPTSHRKALFTELSHRQDELSLLQEQLENARGNREREPHTPEEVQHLAKLLHEKDNEVEQLQEEIEGLEVELKDYVPGRISTPQDNQLHDQPEPSHQQILDHLALNPASTLETENQRLRDLLLATQADAHKTISLLEHDKADLEYALIETEQDSQRQYDGYKKRIDELQQTIDYLTTQIEHHSSTTQ
eukprot:gene8539-5986_t